VKGLQVEAVKPALEAFSLTKGRRAANGELHIWRCPDIVVDKGQFVAILADHETDLKLLLGMLSGLVEPTGGVLRINGEDVGDLRRPQRATLRAHQVGFLFQEPKLLPEFNLLDNVVLPQRYVAGSRRQATERGRSLLQRLGLGNCLSKKPAALTTLQAQFVALARALVNHPVILLAHDPVAELAAEDRELFLQALQALCREEGVAILLGTCQPQLAERAARTIRLPAAAPEPIPLSDEEISSADLFTDLYDIEISPLLRPVAPLLDLVVKPLLYTAAVAVVIVFLTFFGLEMAGLGRAGIRVDLGRVIADGLGASAEYLGGLLRGDLGTYARRNTYYYWAAITETSIAEALARTFNKSLALLLMSLALGALIGVPMGLMAAMARHRKFSLLFLVGAIVGVSTPSFFLALLLQLLEIQIYRRTGVSWFPVGGFGWDRHIILPALVLAARPIAQVARVSFVALAEVLDADYIRTARAKGLSTAEVLLGHALRNAGVSILAALGTSLRFALSSLPVVEVIFGWPGMGSLLLEAIRSGHANLAATLALVLGVLFVLTHVALDYLYRWIDPRLREARTGLSVKRSWVDMFSAGWSTLREMPDRLGTLIPWIAKGEKTELAPLLVSRGTAESHDAEQLRRDAKIKQERRRAWVQSTAGSLPFMLGGIILLVLLAMVLWGQQLAPYSPHSPVTSTTIDGELRFAPFTPSEQFLLGTDAQGRDILTLLLYGARRTLSLAFFAVVARVLLGTILGALSGWFAGSLLDRVLTGLSQVIAAFPSLLLAMVLIYAFGIRQGLWIFAVALCLVGWGEVAQFVRGQVMRIREQDYIEGALATGLGDLQLLSRHVLPNLVPSLVIVAFLEMGGVLMILGELGFIGVFIGGGWTTVGTTDSMVTYFDVPEWGVMLSATWRTFRSYPWMTFYPALAFTLSILGFNLFGEGLRRLTERLTLTMHRIINRYTISAALGVGALLLLAAEGTRSWPQFTATANRFDGDRAMATVQVLAAPEMNGRGINTPELESAADYIGAQFAALQLLPAGIIAATDLTYFTTSRLDYRQMESVPSLELRDSSGAIFQTLTYRRDYAELPDGINNVDGRTSEIIFLGVNPQGDRWPDQINANPADLIDKALLSPQFYLPAAVSYLSFRGAVLAVAPGDDYITHRELTLRSLSTASYWRDTAVPFLVISRDIADAILRSGGSTLEQAISQQDKLGPSEGFVLRTGIEATIHMSVSELKAASPRYVQAFITGNDQFLDNELVIVLAHYDGQGRDLDGTLYPGANKNASGVAVMLETARILQEADYRPRRTIMFVAWAGAEMHAAPSFFDMLRSRPGFLDAYRIAAVIELTGVGAGAGENLILSGSTSGRLTEVLQQAAKRSGVSASTLGTGIQRVYQNLYPVPDKKIPYISLTWEGSYTTAHTPQDTVDTIEPSRLREAGRVAALAVMYLGHEKEY